MLWQKVLVARYDGLDRGSEALSRVGSSFVQGIGAIGCKITCLGRWERVRRLGFGQTCGLGIGGFVSSSHAYIG